MRQSGYGDPAITLADRMGDIQRSAGNRDGGVHREHSASKARFDDMIEPAPQLLALRVIAALDVHHAQFQLEQRTWPK